jgi:hypothetical protein
MSTWNTGSVILELLQMIYFAIVMIVGCFANLYEMQKNQPN